MVTYCASTSAVESATRYAASLNHLMRSDMRRRDQNRPGSHENVRAIYWGYVAFTGWIEGLGRVVIIDHTLGYTSLYGHLSSIAVTVGEKVKTGQTIGELGDSGSFFGERLYLELRENGRALNPLPWLK